MKIKIILTYSKIMAFIVLVASIFLDYLNENAISFMYSLPFITFLITGKMLSDYKQNQLKTKQNE